MKIALISTSRADYSALAAVGVELGVAGYDVAMIKRHPDGRPEWRPPMVRARGLIFDLIVSDLERLQPDLAFVHGDRWDALLAATACVMRSVPLAHIGGGEITEGSYDNRFRDAITRLACLHFAGTEQARCRINEQISIAPIGEIESQSYLVGEPALDWLKTAKLLPRDELFRRLNFSDDGFILVNWQPETNAERPNAGLRLILDALDGGSAETRVDSQLVFINPNDDEGCAEALQMIKMFCSRPAFRSATVVDGGLTREDYASVMKHCDVMVGNSSSGLIEAPVFGTQFILVGNRQRGRAMGSNTLWVNGEASAESLRFDILCHLEMARSIGGVISENPYGDGHAGEKIAKVLESWIP